MRFKLLFFPVNILLLILFSSELYSQKELDSLSVGYIDSLKVKDSINDFSNREFIDGIISYSKKFLGVPYEYAGTSPVGFDCSGFIYYVFGNFGFTITRTSYSMAEFGETIMLSQVRAGDLLFFKGRSLKSTSIAHVALVVSHDDDGIKMIHSSSSRGVVIDNFSRSKYFIPRFLKAKRLDYGVED
jgi:cell wall-associated NlpC family hydrolase